MARCLIAVLALAATVAHAQDSSKATKEATAAAPPDRIVSRSPPTPSAGAGALSGGAGTGVSVSASCPVVDIYLADAEPNVRTYEAPRSGLRRAPGGVWEQAPYVQSVTHCGRLYVFKVVSRSEDAWVVASARLEGPKGATLHVNDLRVATLTDGLTINVIVAEAPPGVTFPDVTLHLTGKDGRVARPEARDLL